MIDNGLRSLEDPTYGGWGGRFGYASNQLYINNVLDYDVTTNQYEAQYSLTRWFDDIQNDFAARVEWTLTPNTDEVNHAPVVSVKEGVDINAIAGQEIVLTAEANDQDGDDLTYKWWRYFEADTYQDSKSTKEDVEDDSLGLLLNITRELDENEVVDSIEIFNGESEKMSFVVPEDAESGDTIHMIVEVQDSGKYQLKQYQRIIITVE